MKCACGGDSAVVATSHRKDHAHRRRRCQACGLVFTTVELTAARYAQLQRPPAEPDTAVGALHMLIKAHQAGQPTRAQWMQAARAYKLARP